jgi:hypothetical protein
VAKDEKKVLDKDTNIVETKRKKSHSVTSNKKYESFNIVSETGDSIYSPSFEELPNGGQIYVSLTQIQEIIREIVRQELAAAIGVQVKSENE